MKKLLKFKAKKYFIHLNFLALLMSKVHCYVLLEYYTIKLFFKAFKKIYDLSPYKWNKIMLA